MQMSGIEQDAVRSVLIVGGGTSGWITAAYLAKVWGAGQPGGIRIRLIESKAIGTIGVGEGTFPTIKRTLSVIGISEAEFMAATSATFKQGIRFVDWAKTPMNGQHSHYFHPFHPPRMMEQVHELTPYWLMGLAGNRPFAQSVCIQDPVVEAGKGPKRPGEPDYDGPLYYAYHLDAGKFADLLRHKAIALGVEHIIGDIETVVRGDNGDIAHVTTQQHGDLSADLFIDCSGFASLLLGQTMQSEFRDMNSVLFVDRAVAMQVPYTDPQTPIATTTISTAQENGWTWDIALSGRRGTGYVYSSRYTDDDRAEAVLRAYVGPEAEKLSARVVPMKIGYRPRHWVGNCVGVGLAGGFLEPLESTGIVLIEAAAQMLGEGLPRRGDMAKAAERFNRAMTTRYERIVDFIKLHFCLSQRRDTAFWIDNADPATSPDSLKALLALWTHRPPSRFDFDSTYETFNTHSWQYVLYGMGFKTDLGDAQGYWRIDQARETFDAVRRAGQAAVSALPLHRTLRDAIADAKGVPAYLSVPA